MGKNEHSSQLSPGKLTYKIHSCTSHSSSYVAQNILENKPSEQSSRWSSESNHPPQFIVLKLDKPAIVTGILFGKFEKTHVCNLKKFKVFGGLDESSYIELLESGLKNNSSPDSFNLRCELNQHYFPCSFIKIQPIQSWGSSFNFTVWYVELIGDENPTLVQESIDWQKKNSEREAIRLCLKHFREHNYSEAFESLEKKTKVQLEDPLLTRLYNILVKDGDYEGVEELIKECLKNGIFRDYISRQQPKPIWNPLINPDDTIIEDIVGPGSVPAVPLSDSESLVSDEERPPPPSLLLTEPPPRGGHQLVMDSTAQSIYLFGGWDGNQDLADFWSYHVPSNRWNLLFPDTEAEAGPPPRSCHKMVLDPAYRQIFVLGRYIERTMRVSLSAIKSDFYLFDLVSGRWTQITDDTAAMGGPNLIFDHQMCLDNEHRNIYVFGGQSLHYNNTGEDRSDKRFSGLYVYHINTNTWKLLWDDGQIPAKGPPIISRTGHSMLFNSVDRNLYIFGGQRKRDEYLNDFFTFNVDTHEIKFLSDGITSSGSSIPAVGYTQRATIDCKREEIYVMTGLNKDKEKKSGETGVSNSFWVYEIKPARWSCIYRNEKNSPAYWNIRQSVEPRPRYAHQLVYDEEAELHYLFGGNPGGKEGKEGKIRLGDFWSLGLLRPAQRDLERCCKLSIRTSRFKELCRSPHEALRYLQETLSGCVDHGNPDEEKQFQKLPASIFNQNELINEHEIRSTLFKSLVTLFPPEMTQPTGNLVDLIPLDSSAHGETSNPQPFI